jgi:hypothetical protein
MYYSLYTQEVQSVLRTLNANKQHSSSEKEGDDKGDKDVIIVDDDRRKPPSIEGTVRILKALFELEKFLDSAILNKTGPGYTPSLVLPGSWLCTMLEAAGFTHALAGINTEEIRRCSNYLIEEQSNGVGGKGGSGLSVPEPKLCMLASAFSRVYRGRTLQECVASSIDYKVFICEEDAKPKDGYNQAGSGSGQVNGRGGVWAAGGNAGGNTGGTKKRVLNFWAFSPGIAMEDLKKLGVRSILLTSGKWILNVYMSI